MDGGATWFTLGAVEPGINSATITGLTPGVNVMFAVSSGGASTPGGSNSFVAPPPGSTGRVSVNPGATRPVGATPLSRPTLLGETVGYNLSKNGHRGFQVGTNYYLAETVVLSTEMQD